MISRERVIKAIEHEEPDRVPMSLWLTKEAYENIKNYLNYIDVEENILWASDKAFYISKKLVKRLNLDIVQIHLPPPIDYKPKTWPDGSFEGPTGFRTKKVGLYYEYKLYPTLSDIEDVSDLEDKFYERNKRQLYLFDPNAPRDIKPIIKQAKEFYEEGYALSTFSCLFGMVEPPWYYRGLKNWFIDLIQRPKIARKMIELVSKVVIEYDKFVIDTLGEYLTEIIGGGDVATQNSMQYSPKIFREYFGEVERLYVNTIKKKAPHIKLCWHGCGAMRPVIKDIIEWGYDILNPIQPYAGLNTPFSMEPGSIKEEYGDKICFEGAIDVQKTLPRGSLKDIEEEVKLRIKQLAPGGGYILAPSHNFQADTSGEKIVAVYDYAMKYGEYPINI